MSSEIATSLAGREAGALDRRASACRAPPRWCRRPASSRPRRRRPEQAALGHQRAGGAIDLGGPCRAPAAKVSARGAMTMKSWMSTRRAGMGAAAEDLDLRQRHDRRPVAGEMAPQRQPAAAAAAWSAAIDTAIMALPPRRDLSGVPSSAISVASIAAWSAASAPTSAGAISSRMPASAPRTSSPPRRGPPSRRSTASPAAGRGAGRGDRAADRAAREPHLRLDRRPAARIPDAAARAATAMTVIAHRPSRRSRRRRRPRGVGGGAAIRAVAHAGRASRSPSLGQVLDRRLAVDPGEKQRRQQRGRARLERRAAPPSRRRRDRRRRARRSAARKPAVPAPGAAGT